MLFIHEVATDRRLWQWQWRYFQGCHRPIAVEVFGHGRQPWHPHELSLPDTARQIQQLLERLDTGRVFAIGVSLGAAVAVQVALNSPTLVEGLVLVSPWTHADEHVRSIVERLFRLAEAHKMETHMDLFLRYVFPPSYVEQRLLDVHRLRGIGLEQKANAVASAWAACQRLDLRGKLEGVRAPTLVIAGLNDLLTPPYLARAVAEGLVKSQLEIWEGTGHFPFLEDPRRFNRRLEDFIQHCLERAVRGQDHRSVPVNAPAEVIL
jgi:pimeloyl-ACP methyl ester carboxylesterase